MKTKIFKIIRIIAILVCLGTIAYESYKIYDDQKEYQVAKNEYEELENIAVSYPLVEDEAAITDYPLLQIDFDRLKSINDDVVAWIYFPTLDISYPVVHENEIDEYLYVTFDGTSNKSGSIFEDVLSDPEFRGMHDIVFGHNMKNGTMFGSLKKLYQGEGDELLSTNPYVYIYTEEYVFQYRVFGYYLTKVGSEAYKVVKTDDTYDEFLEYIQYHSAYKRPDDADFSIRPGILTLSTCSGTSGSGNRFVVHTYKTAVYAR